jgi:hypothetical protein
MEMGLKILGGKSPVAKVRFVFATKKTRILQAVRFDR